MILCVSDSFGLPRPGTGYSQTWIARLRAARPDLEFVGLFKRKANTDMLAELDYGEYLTFYSPTTVILQLGICDCAPRYVRTVTPLYKLLNHLPPIAWKTVKALCGRKPKRTDVAPARYRTNVAAYIDRCRREGVEKVIIVKIGVPTEPMVSSNPGILANVAAYNALLDEVTAANPDIVVCADPLASPAPGDYLADGYHPSPDGHALIASALLPLIS